MENWKPVPDYEGVYEASDLGNVRRLPNLRLLKPRNCSNGYKMVHLRNRGRDKQRLIHALVIETFVGPRPPGQVVSHKDHIKSHNWFSNLEYVTYSRNNQLSGRRGENHSSCKLTKTDIVEAKWLRWSGVTVTKLAELFDCSMSHLSTILGGKTRVLA